MDQKVKDVVNRFPFKWRQDLIQECFLLIHSKTGVNEGDLVKTCETFILKNTVRYEIIDKAKNVADPDSIDN